MGPKKATIKKAYATDDEEDHNDNENAIFTDTTPIVDEPKPLQFRTTAPQYPMTPGAQGSAMNISQCYSPGFYTANSAYYSPVNSGQYPNLGTPSWGPNMGTAQLNPAAMQNMTHFGPQFAVPPMQTPMQYGQQFSFQPLPTQAQYAPQFNVKEAEAAFNRVVHGMSAPKMEADHGPPTNPSRAATSTEDNFEKNLRQIQKDVTVAAALPLITKLASHDTRSASSFRLEVEAVVGCLGSRVTFFYLKRAIDATLWRRLSIAESHLNDAASFANLLVELWATLGQLFNSASTRQALYQSWSNLRQRPNETLSIYIDRFRKVLQEREALGISPCEDEAVLHLKAGILDPAIVVWLLPFQNLTYKQVEYMLLERDIQMSRIPQLNVIQADTKASDRNRNASSWTFPCQRCSLRGHSTRDCPSQPANPTKGACKSCGHSHTTPSDCRALAYKCMRCKSTGHFEKFCTSTTKIIPGSTPGPSPMVNEVCVEEVSTTPHPIEIVPGGTSPIEELLEELNHVSVSNNVIGLPELELSLDRNEYAKPYKLTCLLDSGATDSFISADTYEELKREGCVSQVEDLSSDKTARVADGRTLRLICRATLTVRLETEGEPMQIRFYVVPELHQRCILALGELRLRKCIWIMNPDGDQLSIGEQALSVERKLLRDACESTTRIPQLNHMLVEHGETVGPLRLGYLDFVEEVVPDEPMEEPISIVVIRPEITDVDQRYTGYLPWVSSERPCRNMRSASARNEQLMRRLGANIDLARDRIKYMLEKQYIKQVTQNEACHFIPLRIVWRLEKKNSCRITLDGTYINKYLHSISACKNMAAVFTTWRTLPKFFNLDLTDAFLKIKVVPSDAKYLSFLFDTKVYCFEVIPFGLCSSPAILEATLADIFAGVSNKTSESKTCPADPSSPLVELDALANAAFLQRPSATPSSFTTAVYVDDITVGGSDAREAGLSTVLLCRELMKFGFSINPSKTITNVEPFATAGDTKHAFLGHCYDSALDAITLVTNLHTEPMVENATRTSAISWLSRLVYDPYGLALAHHCCLKIWYRRILAATPGGWKDKVPTELLMELKQWILTSPLSRVPLLSISRKTDGSKVHVFSDASAIAQGFAMVDRDFVPIRSRCQLYPVDNKWTIPQKELDALCNAVVAFRQDYYAALENGKGVPERVIFFCDNQSAIWRLKRIRKTLPAFEKRRVTKIREILAHLPCVATVQFIPTELNLSDGLSRPDPMNGPPEISLEMLTKYCRFYEEIDVPLQYSPADSIEVGMDDDEDDVSDIIGINHIESNALITLPELVAAQLCDEYCISLTAAIGHRLATGVHDTKAEGFQIRDGVLINTSMDLKRPVLPDTLKSRAIHDIHRDAGHPGVSKTTALTNHEWYVKRLRQTVRRTIERCRTCIQTKGHRSLDKVVGHLTFEKLTPPDLPDHGAGFSLFAVVGMDHLFFEETIVLVLVDFLSKFVATRCVTNASAACTIEALQSIFSSEGVPRVIISDAHAAFESNAFRRFCINNRIRGIRLTPNSSSLAGWYNVRHKTLNEILRGLVLESANAIAMNELVAIATLKLNSLPYSEQLPLTPFQLNRGYEPRGFATGLFDKLDTIDESQLPDVLQNFERIECQEHLESLERTLTEQGKFNFEAYRDHFRLLKEESHRQLINRSNRYKQKLTEFDEVVVYKPGTKLAPRWELPIRRIMQIRGNSIGLLNDGSLHYLCNLKKVHGGGNGLEEDEEPVGAMDDDIPMTLRNETCTKGF